MKSNVAKIFLLLLIILSFTACWEYNYPYFWKVKKGDVEIHLLGSQHMFTLEQSQEIYPLNDEVYEVINKADKVFFERDWKNERFDKLSKIRNFSDGDSLGNFMPLPLNFESLLRKRFKRVGHIIENDIYLKKPMSIGYNYFSHWAASQGIFNDFGIDHHIYKRIPRERMAFLEPKYFTYKLKYSKPIPLQIDELLHFLVFDPYESIEKRFFKSSELFLSGDLDGVAEFYRVRTDEFKWSANDEKSRALSKQIMKTRNEKWMEMIFEEAKPKKSYLVVGGLAHFFGDHNVIDMFKARGFSVERLWSPYPEEVSAFGHILWHFDLYMIL